MSMADFNRILAAVAFSPDAQGLMNYAAAAAGKLDADELIVASVINTRDVEAVSTISSMGYDVDGDNYVQSIEGERKALLDDYIKQIAFPSEKVRLIVKVGEPVEELLKITVKEQVDLMVMGIKGRTNLEYILVGSVAEKIFRRSPVPILSYRSENHAQRLRRSIRIP